MRIINSAFRASIDFFKAFSFIIKNKLSHYFIYPLLITLVFFFLLVGLKNEMSTISVDYVETWLNLKSLEEGSWLEYLRMGIDGLVYITVWTTVTLLFFSTNKYLNLILLSPVLAFLSERTEEILTGKKYPFNFNYFIKDIVRGIVISIRNLLLEYTVIISLSVLTFFIPVIAPFTLVLEFLFGFYFIGFAFVDYSLERRRFSIKHSVQFNRKYLGLPTANGMWFTLLFQIPIIGGMFAPIIATVGAAITTEKIMAPFEEQNKEYYKR